jgi:phytoene dehydrogenase-like protein
VTTRRRDVVVVGSGHNGLVAACYLARAGLDVEVVEQDTVAGGAVSTMERWPGVRVDRGSSIHVMIRHTGIVEDLALEKFGLVYDDVEPWAVVPDPLCPLRFSADLDDTCVSIEAACGSHDADAYRRFVGEWTPRMTAYLEAAASPPSPLSVGRAMSPLYRTRPSGWGETTHAFLRPAEAVLAETFTDDRLRAAIGWWSAQSGTPPHEPGTAPMAGTVALLHLRPAGRPRGGSGRLTEALAARLAADGGSLRLGDAVTAIAPGGDGNSDSGRVTVSTASGDRIVARAVVSGAHASTTARLLGDTAAAGRVRAGDGVGVALRLLTDALPAYPVEVPGAHTSMQLLVRSTGQIRAAYADLLRGEPAHDPPMIVMTPTATDSTLAPAGRHVVTVWSQWHPYRLAEGTWDSRLEEVADGLLDRLDEWAPGTSSTVIQRLLQTPADLERELGLAHGNVMHVESGLDGLFALRPLPGWSGYRAPYPGVYLCGASTHPGGGVWGVSGRSVATLVRRDLDGRPWRRLRRR